MRGLVLTICLVCGAAVGATEVYRWVDEQGQVHYSDLPQEGAERVQLNEAQTFPAPPVRPPARGTADTSEPAAAPTRYQTLEIVEPSQEEVLWNIEGQLDVSIRLEPRLQPGHSLALYLDDQLQDKPPASLQARLTNVVRGVHVLRAEVKDPAGNVLIRSQPRTFSVQQTSILNPNNPANAPLPAPRNSP